MAEFSRSPAVDGSLEADDRSTMMLRVTEPRRSGSDSGGVLGDYSSLPSDTLQYEVPGIQRFSYTNDILSIGDPWSAVVPDPRGLYRDRLRPGALVEVFLRNSIANQGQWTRKLKGRIRQRSVEVNGQGGTVITLSGADLGMHLQSNPPQWKSLRGISWEKLLNAILEPSWGLSGVQLGNDVNMRLNNGRVAKQLALRPKLALDPFARIEVSPGQSCADLLITYARRAGLLFNVSADGYLKTFTPDYSSPALYKLRLFEDTDPQSVQNNVERMRLEEGADTLYTHVVCTAESVYTPQEFAQAAALAGNGQAVAGQGGAVYQADVHAGKHRGFYTDTTVLPYTNRVTFCDGDMFSARDAYTRAFWKFNRGRFDAWTLTATFRGHAQGGEWWEADTLCDCDIDVPALKFRGSLYVSRVVYSSTDAGDLVDVTLKPPNLLYEVPVV